MIGQSVTFDGHLLNDLFHVGNVQTNPPEFDVQSHEVGSDGVAVEGVRLGEATVEVPLIVRPNVGVTPRAALSALLSWMDVDGPRTLELSEDGGYARVVVPSGVTMDDQEYKDRMTATFTQVEPCLYGRTEDHAIPSGGTLEFDVGGTYPCGTVVTCDAAQRDPTTGLWGLTFDGGDGLHVKIPTALATTVSIDVRERRVLVGGAVSMVTLASDWPRLSAGVHTVTMDQGTGAATITITERCL